MQKHILLLLMTVGLAQGAAQHARGRIITVTNLTQSTIEAINGDPTYFFDPGTSKCATVSGKNLLILQFAANSELAQKTVTIRPYKKSWRDIARGAGNTLYILQLKGEVRAMWGYFLTTSDVA